jgi:hypothetical protein
MREDCSRPPADAARRGAHAIGFLGAAAAVLVAALVAACGPTPDYLLSGGAEMGGPQRPMPGGADGGSALPTSPEQAALKARELFDALRPDLENACGSCHANGTAGAPKFLEKPDVYASVKAFKGLVIKDYTNSRLLVVGPETGHSGGAGLDPTLRPRVTEWLRIESLAMVEAPLPTTEAIAVVAGPNTLDLSKASPLAAGGRVTFDATIAGTLLRIANLRISAPATKGIRVTRPVFNMVQANGRVDPDGVDNFSNTELSVQAGQTATLGAGGAAFTTWQWAPDAKLSLSFAQIEEAKAVNDVPTGGCKSVATFTSSAVPAMQPCRNCHSNGAARNALDMSQIGTNDGAACAQALNKVDLQNKAQSRIITYITAPNTTHAGTRLQGDAATNYTQQMLGWINQE